MTVSTSSSVLPDFLPWDEFMARWRWHQGEHVTIIGPTGTGKTTLMRAILRKRYDAGGYVAALGSKTEDAGLEAWLREDQLTRVYDWPPRWPGRWWTRPRDNDWQRRVMLWPKINTPADLRAVGPTFQRALVDMFVARQWCVAVDEVYYLCKHMGLAEELEAWWSQGRSAGLTVVAATQQPVHIPLLAYGSATHLFLFKDPDLRRVERIAELAGLPKQQIIETMVALPFHHVLYVNTRTREVAHTRVR